MEIICEDTGEVKKFEFYFTSRHWKQLKEKMRLKYAPKHICPVCKDKKKYFELKHLTYVRIGKELEEDVEVMCRACFVASKQNIPPKQ